jgi:antitoxin ParD1/3/4
MTTITLELPDDVAERAREEGLLDPGRIQDLLEQALAASPENEETRMSALRRALEEGERSGPATDFDFERFLAAKRRETPAP